MRQGNVKTVVMLRKHEVYYANISRALAVLSITQLNSTITIHTHLISADEILVDLITQ